MRDGRSEDPRAHKPVTGKVVAMASAVVAPFLSLLPLILLSACERAPKAGEAIPIVQKFGEVGDGWGQVSYPRAIDTDEGSVWVVDKLARVQRFNAKTGVTQGGWRMPQWQVGKPTGVTAWAPKGSSNDAFVFVPDTHYHRVCVYRVTRRGVDHAREIGELVAQFGSYGEGPGQFVYPTDVVVIANAAGDGVERLLVSEYGGNDRINVYQRKDAKAPGAGGDYEFVTSFGKFGIAGEDDADGSLVFNRLQSIALDATRNEIVLTDACNHRIGRVTIDGKLVAWYGCSPSSPRASDPAMKDQPRLLYPYGLAVASDGTALVAEFGGVRVHRVDLATGASLGTYGKQGRNDGELLTPWGVAVAGDDVFVLDSGNNRVQEFRLPRARSLAKSENAGSPAAPKEGAP